MRFKRRSTRFSGALLALALLFSLLSGCGYALPDAELPDAPAYDFASAAEAPSDHDAAPGTPEENDASAGSEDADSAALAEDGVYTTAEDVALYLHLYGRLPGNFISKKEARELGWDSGGLDGYADGMCIGGDRFGNYEGLLPDAPGREYHECDIGTLHAKSRGAKRIVYSNDGLIYYTEDHYESFVLLYGEE